MNDTVIVHLDSDNKKLKVVNDYPKNNLSPFSPIGLLNMQDAILKAETKNKQLSPDVFELLVSLKPIAQRLFIELKQRTNESDNTIPYKVPTPNKSQANKLYTALKALRAAGIIKKIKPSLYMLNPHLIKCRYAQDLAVVKWDNL